MDVAPYAGAWVEIAMANLLQLLLKQSHPMRVRGLKYGGACTFTIDGMSHPMRVRGLKWQKSRLDRVHRSVAPYAGAWVEIGNLYPLIFSSLSHPMRVRGLKFCVPKVRVLS